MTNKILELIKRKDINARLNMNVMDVVKMAILIERKFGIHISGKEMYQFNTVQDVVNITKEKVYEKGR